MKLILAKIVPSLLLSIALAACSGQSSPTPEPTASVGEAPSQGSGEAVSGQRIFVIVPAESKASYLVDEEFFASALDKLGIAAGLVDVVGSTQEIEGQITLNLDNLGDALGENTFTVKMNTLRTDRNDRDKWIRENGPRFNEYPLATFTATSIEGAPVSYRDGDEVSFKLVGNLTVREVTQPATFDVTAQLAGDTLTGVATTRTLMSGFGIEPPNFANTLTVADEFGIEVQFTARAQ